MRTVVLGNSKALKGGHPSYRSGLGSPISDDLPLSVECQSQHCLAPRRQFDPT
jgi:hypothetical protein